MNNDKPDMTAWDAETKGLIDIKLSDTELEDLCKAIYDFRIPGKSTFFGVDLAKKETIEGEPRTDEIDKL